MMRLPIVMFLMLSCSQEEVSQVHSLQNSKEPSSKPDQATLAMHELVVELPGQADLRAELEGDLPKKSSSMSLRCAASAESGVRKAKFVLFDQAGKQLDEIEAQASCAQVILGVRNLIVSMGYRIDAYVADRLIGSTGAFGYEGPHQVIAMIFH